MTEKTVEVELKARPQVLVKIKTQDGDALLRFKNLNQRDMTKLQIDLEKNLSIGLEKVLASVCHVENLKDDGEAVTLEQIQTGDISQELTGALFQAFIKVITARNEGDVDPKKEQMVADLAQG